MAAPNNLFQNVPKFKIWPHFVILKPAATPTFCERNFSRIYHFGIMNFLFFFSTTGDRRFAWRGYFNKTLVKNKVCNGHRSNIRQLLRSKSAWIIINFFAQTCIIWNIFSPGTKNWHMGSISHSVFIFGHKFANEIENDN